MLEQRQRAQCSSAHRSASALRANTMAAVTEQAAEVRRHRHSVANEVKRSVEEAKRQIDEQKLQWNAHGRAVGAAAAASRRGAASARNHVRASNLSEAQRSCAERLDMFRQSAEAQSALNDGKRLMAERVRREAGLAVVRGALSRASSERGAQAAQLRSRSQSDLFEMEKARLLSNRSKQNSASRVELEASPDRVRELKGVEARRKAGLTGALRDQYRAFEVRPPPLTQPALCMCCVPISVCPHSDRKLRNPRRSLLNHAFHSHRLWRSSDVPRNPPCVRRCMTQSCAPDSGSLSAASPTRKAVAHLVHGLHSRSNVTLISHQTPGLIGCLRLTPSQARAPSSRLSERIPTTSLLNCIRIRTGQRCPSGVQRIQKPYS